MLSEQMKLVFWAKGQKIVDYRLAYMALNAITA